MSVYFKNVDKLVSKATDLTTKRLDKQLIELELSRELSIQKINQEVAVKYAKNLGLVPIKDFDKIRDKLNERIIQEVKERKLRHKDVAIACQIPRTRVTAIMNRHLERVTVDCMIQILNVLGVQTTIHLSTPDVY